MVRTAYLRVYQPLDAFEPEERERLLSLGENRTEEAVATRRWLIATALPEAGSASAEGAFVREVAGVTMVCPWRTRLRMLAGLLAFRGSLPDEVADAFVPESHARLAADELAMLGAQRPDIRSHILHANWHVPLRWFAAFEDTERILTEDKDGLRVRYETTLAQAQTRLRRCLEILEASWIDSAVVAAVQELIAWVDAFPADGLVELDYGTVAEMFADDDLVDDRSAAEVSACLDALEAGDVITAGRLFAGLTDRWTEVRAHEVVN